MRTQSAYDQSSLSGRTTAKLSAKTIRIPTNTPIATLIDPSMDNRDQSSESSYEKNGPKATSEERWTSTPGLKPLKTYGEVRDPILIVVQYGPTTKLSEKK